VSLVALLVATPVAMVETQERVLISRAGTLVAGINSQEKVLVTTLVAMVETQERVLISRAGTIVAVVMVQKLDLKRSKRALVTRVVVEMKAMATTKRLLLGVLQGGKALG